MGDSYRPGDPYRSSDSYRPSYNGRDAPQGSSYHPPLPQGPPPPLPPSPRGLPPLPSGPPPMQYFGQDVNRHNGFAFRANGGPQYPRDVQAQPTYPHERAKRHPYRRQDGRPGRGYNHNMNRQGYQPRKRVKPADRDLLTATRGSTPEQMAGMTDDVEARKFIDFDDLSDSSEAPMDESDAEANDQDGMSVEVNKEKPAAAVVEPAKPAPHWSNPEVYTSLPPVEGNTDRKKKDVVKLIRKARLAADNDAKKVPTAAESADFISFDFGDENNANDDDPVMGDYTHSNGAPAGAPTQPRAFDQPIALPSKPTMNVTSTMLSLPSLTQVAQGVEVVTAGETVATHMGQLEPNRKRKRDDTDEILLIAPVTKRGRGPRPTGSVLSHWADVEPVKALPWLTEDHKATENPGFRLHKEICDFYDFVKPRHYEHKIRLELLQRLQTVMSEWNREVTVYSFGSFAAGLYLPNADMDIVVVSNAFARSGLPHVGCSPPELRRVEMILNHRQVSLPGSTEVIAKAKVPLVKYVDRLTRIKVDLSFENNTGIIANDTFQSWKAKYPAMPILVTIIKQFLMMRGLNEVSTGGLGGFSVTCLVVSLLQNMPRMQMQQFVPEHHLGELLLEFLDLYGNRLDYTRTALRMNPAGYVDKNYAGTSKRSKPDRLCIIDPTNPGNDISGGTSEIELIFDRFAAAREEVLLAMERNRKSLLDWALGGNYNDFLWHRRELRNIYEDQYGDTESDDEMKAQVMEKGIQNNINVETVAALKNAPPVTNRMRKSQARMQKRAREDEEQESTLGSKPAPAKKKKGNKTKKEGKAKSKAKEKPDLQILGVPEIFQPEFAAWSPPGEGVKGATLKKAGVLWRLSRHGQIPYETISSEWTRPVPRQQIPKNLNKKRVQDIQNVARSNKFQQMFPHFKSVPAELSMPDLIPLLDKATRKAGTSRDKQKSSGKSKADAIEID